MDITVKGTVTTLLGKDRSTGTESPAVRVKNLDGKEEVIGGERINAQLIVTIPSLKTEVCSLGAKKLNELLNSIEKLDAYAVTTDSADVIFEFVSKNCVEKLKILIDEDRNFGKAFGVLIGDGMLKDKLARSAFVIDKEGIIIHKEIVPEITDEIDYEAAIKAIEIAKQKKKKGAHGHHHHGW